MSRYRQTETVRKRMKDSSQIQTKSKRQKKRERNTVTFTKRVMLTRSHRIRETHIYKVRK